MSGMSAEVAVMGLALGLVLSLVCYLTTNLSPGGMITPGWLAITLVEDARRAIIIAVVVVLTYFGTKGLQRIVILYGKRLFAAVVLMAVFLQLTIFLFLLGQFPLLFSQQTLGFIIPGLIAYQLIRQPIVPTVVATTAVTGVTWAVLYAGAVLRLLPGT